MNISMVVVSCSHSRRACLRFNWLFTMMKNDACNGAALGALLPTGRALFKLTHGAKMAEHAAGA